MNWCWWRFTHTFCHSSNILGCTYCLWLFKLWFIDGDTKHTALTVLLFFQNPYAVFAHILQHYHDFHSNYASRPKFPPNRDSSAFQCRRAGFLGLKCNNYACLHTRQDQNELHLKRCFFAKIGIFCEPIAGPFPSAVQEYTQPYAFDGRMKLIICQIIHEL